MPRLALALLTLGLAGGCDAPEPEPAAFSITPYLGTYVGTRTINVIGGDTETEAIALTISAESESRTVEFSLRGGGGARSPEILRGTYDETGIRAGGRSNGFVVDPAGKIDGSFSAFGTGGTISGRLTPSAFGLTYRLANGNTLTDIQTFR